MVPRRGHCGHSFKPPGLGIISLSPTKELIAYNNAQEAQIIPEKKPMICRKPRSNPALNRKAKCVSEILNKNYPKKTQSRSHKKKKKKNKI